MLRLSFKDTSKHAGMIRSSTIYDLIKNYSVRMDAVLLAPSGDKARDSKKTMTDTADTSAYLSQDCTARIVVYGLRSEKSAIGNILSDAGFFLQHPPPDECDRHMEYINPQYLLRPGSHMPNLEDLIMAEKHSKPTDNMDGITKSQFMRIFDQADAQTNSIKVKPSLRLRSILKEYAIISCLL